MPPKIYYAIFLLQKPMEEKIHEIRPDCIFSDMYFPWTVDIAEEMKIPRIQSSYTYNSVLHNLKMYKPQEEELKLESNSQSGFLVLWLPDKIEFKLSQLTDDLRKAADDDKISFDS
ncbi:hypothetical protein HAX54_041508 [Datura stramonium]|uniref:Uncharacterized protein n=1 Tax=Datura stramonium TaxID=4076 RepID=A0ABS8VP60_DATST|nr:hypothetical protein [Datura stramonium]